MGSSLGTPAKCQLCGELTGDFVTLKCNHYFCQRCIGDLWSVNPDGPYHCPKWRCKTVYRSMPFDKSMIRHQANPSSRAQPRSASGTLNPGVNVSFVCKGLQHFKRWFKNTRVRSMLATSLANAVIAFLKLCQ